VQLHQYLVFGPAKENWMKKSQNMPVWLSKMNLAQHFQWDAETGKRHSKA
jgi:hypothetical protein